MLIRLYLYNNLFILYMKTPVTYFDLFVCFFMVTVSGRPTCICGWPDAQRMRSISNIWCLWVNNHCFIQLVKQSHENLLPDNVSFTCGDRLPIWRNKYDIGDHTSRAYGYIYIYIIMVEHDKRQLYSTIDTQKLFAVLIECTVI